MKLKDLKYKLLTSDKNNLIIMVGVPLSGKSTIIKELLKVKDFDIISRDDIVLELGEGQKKVDKLLRERIIELGKGSTDVIIDMTNLGKKRRRMHMSNFPDHVKIALVMETLEMEVLLKRNDIRFKEESKFIPIDILKNFSENFTYPTKEEGFDFIVDM